MQHLATICLLDIAALGDEQLAPYEAWLSEGETARPARFVRAQRRRQFVAGRALLRQLLAPHLGCRPGQIDLIERPGQPPLLGSGTRGPYFSLSHSGPWIACAISSSTPLGLDIEYRHQTRDTGALAAQVFDPEQQVWLAAQPAHARLAAFYHLWCRAEARYKLGTGDGCLVDLAHADLAIALGSAEPLHGAPSLQAVTLLPPGAAWA